MKEGDAMIGIGSDGRSDKLALRFMLLVSLESMFQSVSASLESQQSVLFGLLGWGLELSETPSGTPERRPSTKKPIGTAWANNNIYLHT